MNKVENNIKGNMLNGVQGEIYYPKLAFAFNPISISILHYRGREAVTVKFKMKDSTDYTNEYSIKKETYLNVIYQGDTPTGNSYDIAFDVSAYARTLFDERRFHERDNLHINLNKADKHLFKTIYFGVFDKNSTLIYEGSIPVIWGALQIGEIFSQSKTLTYFKGYPFTVPLYVEDKVLLRSGSETHMRIVDAGKYILDIAHFGNPSANTVIGVYPDPDEGEKDEYGAEKKKRIFDYTFDYTFGVDCAYIRLNVVDCPNEGTYLRWINKHGEYNYFLFSHLNRSYEVKDNSVRFDRVYDTVYLTNNYHHGAGQSIGKEVQEVVDLYASLVDEHQYKIIKDLPMSPLVDLFMGYDSNGRAKWINVNIKDGTFSEGRDHLKDFNFTLLMPKTQVQQL